MGRQAGQAKARRRHRLQAGNSYSEGQLNQRRDIGVRTSLVDTDIGSFTSLSPAHREAMAVKNKWQVTMLTSR
jgi:tetrahydromethanopterin S-methyltransferase subunit H